MKKYFFIFLFMLPCTFVSAQVPNFGTTTGHLNMYGYTSLKYRVNANTWETYSTVQLGLSDYFQSGVDLYTGGQATYIGYVVRGGYKICDYFKIGAQLTPSFNLTDKHKFSYLTSAVYINGNITKDGRLFYVTDLWLENDKENLTSANQWTYLGYTFALPGVENSITPIGGMIHSWKFDKVPDLSMGCYFTHKNTSVYIWANDIVTDHPRFIAALEFKFNTK